MSKIKKLYFATALVACTGIIQSGHVAAAIDCTGTTPIYEIQGATHVSPFNNVEVETCGVVTAVAFNGYYLQDPIGDGDDNTSDGIYVFQRGDKPAVGDMLRVKDTVTEFIPGGASTGNLSITQLSFPEIIASESGHPLPAPVLIGRRGRAVPNETVISASEIQPPINLQNAEDAAANTFNPNTDGIDFYESLEGMLVKISKPISVSGIRQFGRFSAEVFVLADRGRTVAPRRARNRRGGINLQPHPDNQGDQNPERIQIQFDGTLFGSTNYPAIKVGDRLGDITGVVGYSFGNFEVNALGAFDIHPSFITQERTRPAKQNNLTVASYNVLNLSAVSDDDDQRNEVGQHIAHNLRAPDIVALQEIQDNNGDTGNCSRDKTPCSNELDADETLQKLVDAIVAVGGPTYAFFTVNPQVETTDDNRDNPDTFGGISLGNIRNAFLYNPARVSLIEHTGLTRDVLSARGVSVPTAFDNSRDPLEAVFDFRGERIIVINNHFSSRFGSSPIFGAIQPFIQAAEDARENQSLAMHEVTAAILANDPNAHVIVLGDLNTFEFTNDLADILPAASGTEHLFNLITSNRDNNRYSFIFEGNSQALDHIFATQALAEKATLDFVHVNVDFPRRFVDTIGSDHEPLVATFRFNNTVINEE